MGVGGLGGWFQGFSQSWLRGGVGLAQGLGSARRPVGARGGPCVESAEFPSKRLRSLGQNGYPWPNAPPKISSRVCMGYACRNQKAALSADCFLDWTPQKGSSQEFAEETGKVCLILFLPTSGSSKMGLDSERVFSNWSPKKEHQRFLTKPYLPSPPQRIPLPTSLSTIFKHHSFPPSPISLLRFCFWTFQRSLFVAFRRFGPTDASRLEKPWRQVEEAHHKVREAPHEGRLPALEAETWRMWAPRTRTGVLCGFYGGGPGRKGPSKGGNTLEMNP